MASLECRIVPIANDGLLSGSWHGHLVGAYQRQMIGTNLKISGSPLNEMKCWYHENYPLEDKILMAAQFRRICLEKDA